MRRFFSLLFPFCALACALLIVRSGTREDIFLEDTGIYQKDLTRLFQLLNQPNTPAASHYALISEIVHREQLLGQTAKMNLFLTSYVAQHPQDPFDGSYLFLVAENYRLAGAAPVAVHYYQQILRVCPDMIEKGKSIHAQCYDQLVRLVTKPTLQRRYFEEYKSQFPQNLTDPVLFYRWGRAYENLGLWTKAINVYTTFLTFPEISIPGDPTAYSRIHSLVDMSKTDKTWIRQDLNSLIGELKRDIQTGDTDSMEKLRAKVGFFAQTWDNSDINSDTLSEAFDIRNFLRGLVREANAGGGTVVFGSKLDEDSSDSEAYLRSSGWNYRFPIWYFYFRRVEYPADPEINGGWEWAGVFLGEKL